jgi:2-hydroxychromene-2-carboxylate isomerase
MLQANWYFDFVSPFAYLQLGKVLAWRARLDITPIPIVFGAVLKAQGNLGPAEIPGKRAYTYRSVLWQAEREGIALRFPPAHPFNSINALRLCVAAGSTWAAVEALFEHIWHAGNSASVAAELASVGAKLGIGNVENAANAASVKSTLRSNTEMAIAKQIFGVPTLQIGSEIFWGNDAAPMIEDYLADPNRFAGPEYRRIRDLPVGIERPR